jgi:predicted DsbA family dithiol-disulfide isomerase
MADALYTAPEPTPAACRAMAARLGLDLDKYDRAVADPNVDAELQANLRWVQTTDRGPPFFWVQDRLITGVPTPEVLAAAIEEARPPGGEGAAPARKRPPGGGE